MFSLADLRALAKNTTARTEESVLDEQLDIHARGGVTTKACAVAVVAAIPRWSIDSAGRRLRDRRKATRT